MSTERQRMKMTIDEVVALLKAREKRSDLPLAERRAIMNRNVEFFPVPAGVATEPVDLGGIEAEWLLPEGASSAATDVPVLLYLHGGGYVIGSPLSHRPMTAELARLTGTRVLSVDYALAPEEPFPAAVRDGVMAYRWLLERGHAPSAIVMGGDSAGGGLVVATLVAARDQGLPMPAGAILMSPWMDLTCDTETYRTRAAADPTLTQQVLQTFADTYLAGADPRDPLASPNFADLSGLPPLFIQVGGEELLLHDARMLAMRAREAGIEADLEVWDRMFHVWQGFYQVLDEADAALKKLAAFVVGRLESARGRVDA